ncbi:MAG: hypothetical protein AAGK28_09870 [Pseudomonadota bacterium]
MMKPLLMGDVIALARAMRAAPEAQRAALIAQVFEDARTAADFARHMRKTHPRLGNGSVMAASAGYPQVPEPWLTDRDYCRCLRDIFDVLCDC